MVLLHVEAAEHLPHFLGGPIDNFSAATGLPSDQIRLLICLLSALPLGYVFRQLPGASAKHLFSAAVGAFFSWFVVGWGFLNVPLSAVLVYALVQVVPRKVAPTVVFVVTVAWLSAIHIYRLYTDYMGWSLDSTMLMMIWTVKASTFAYNVSDGQALNAGEKLSDRESTHIFRAERAITVLPGVLAYFSYVFFFGGVLVGPCFEAKEYFDFVDGSLAKKHGLKTLPNSTLAVLRCVGLGALMYVGIAIAAMAPVNNYLNTNKFGDLPFLEKFVYFWVAITAFRFKYYFAWYFGEAGCVACGFGFNGARKNAAGEVTGYRWDRVSNCDVLAVETAPHMSDLTSNWNMGVNNWLKNYVYFRVEAPKWVIKAGLPQKSFMNLVTKVTSAFWHGFYPAYYIFFIGAWLVGEMDDALRSSFEPASAQTPENKKKRAASWWKGPSSLFELVSWFFMFMSLNYWGVIFALLRADYAWAYSKNMYFLGVWMPVVVTVLCRTVFRRKRARTTDGAAGATATATAGKPAPISTLAAAAVATLSADTPQATPKVISAIHMSAKSPLASSSAEAQHELLPLVEESSEDAPVQQQRTTRRKSSAAEEADSPASGVKSRPRRARSNKAD